MKVTTSPLGDIVTDAEGIALYIFKMDTAGVSNCSGPCATAWPPLLAEGTPMGDTGVTGELSTITRADGTKQLAIEGQALYYFMADAMAPGSTKGQGVGNIWYVVDGTGKQIG